MTNTNKLNEAIERSGLKLIAIAENLGLSTYGLAKKINNITEFKASEISRISELLRITREEREDIFFDQNSDFKSTK